MVARDRASRRIGEYGASTCFAAGESPKSYTKGYRDALNDAIALLCGAIVERQNLWKEEL